MGGFSLSKHSMPHVLIVEDHEENRALLKALLETNGYRVTVAGDRLEARPATPASAAPLEELASHALHESALARELEDKIAQFEAVKRELEESEARFRSLTEMSSDFYWESDTEHRLTARGSADENIGTATAFRGGVQIGERRWEVPYLSPDEAGWLAHRAVLDAHQPFRNFELSRLGADGAEHFVSISGDPVFDRSCAFTGYRGVGTDITERKRAEARLRDSERRHRSIVETSLDGFWIMDTGGHLLEVNDAYCHLIGYEREELLHMRVTDVEAMEDQTATAAHIREVMAKGYDQFETRHRHKNGHLVDIDISAKFRADVDGGCFFVFLRDITERKAAEAKIQRLNQLYAALSQCNEAIVRSASEKELFPQICRTAVQFGGMKMAWIGMIEADTRIVRIAARFGDHADEYLQGIEISVDADHPRGRGPTGSAVRENQPIWRQDFGNQPLLAPWQERRARFGFGASATLPLHRNGVPVGVLTLYAGEVGAFDEAARDLLIEMATDIGFALDNFAREAARARAETELRAAEEQFRGLVEQSIAGIFIIDDEKLAYVNQRYAEIFGYASAEELIGRERLFVVAERDRAAVTERINRQFEGKLSISYDFSAVRKDGATIEIGAHASRATYLGRSAIVGMMQDISEKKRAEEQIQRYVAQIESAFMSTVRVVTTLGEMRDPYTAGHQRRVAEIAVALGAELGFDERRQEGMRVAGYLHDIGKLRVPAEILSKPGKLSPIEFQLVQGHAQAGFDALKDVGFPWPVAEVALQHHERMDGSGYPQGLKGDAILLESRIMAVANVIDALCSHRPYRAALSIEAALAEIERGRDSSYDAKVADACLRLFREKRYRLPV